MDKFQNRVTAGQALAEVLATKTYADPVVLALPRGGVPIGLQVARALSAPLDLIMVRKIGVPYQPELAVAAIVNGDHPELVINPAVARQAGLDRNDIDRLAEDQLREIKRRRSVYLSGRKTVDLKGRTAIVVDDGIATGATVRAALKAVRRQNPKQLILAVPVAPADTLSELRADVDDIICLSTPAMFHAIGLHYVDFSQVSDEEVVSALAEAAQEYAGTKNQQ